MWVHGHSPEQTVATRIDQCQQQRAQHQIDENNLPHGIERRACLGPVFHANFFLEQRPGTVIKKNEQGDHDEPEKMHDMHMDRAAPEPIEGLEHKPVSGKQQNQHGNPYPGKEPTEYTSPQGKSTMRLKSGYCGAQNDIGEEHAPYPYRSGQSVQCYG